MRKFIASMGAAAVMSIMPVLPAAPANAATVVRGTDCYGLALDENSEFIEGASFLGSLMSRTTKSGITTLTCHYDVPEQYWPKKAVHKSGFECTLDGVTSTDTRFSMSPGGRGVLYCTVRS
jgi:hypothetical protein